MNRERALRKQTLEREREALEQQAATAEILTVISGSRAEIQPVFETIVRNAVRLVSGRFAAVMLAQGGRIHVPAVFGDPGFERILERYPIPLDDHTVAGKAILSGEVARLAPIVGNPASPKTAEANARTFGYDSIISAPMVRDGKVFGAITASRREPKPFDEREVALLKTFADQAVIAIENARLFHEMKEALEHQKASAEVLSVISGSIADVQPVFDKIVESCRRLFAGKIVSAGINLVGEDGQIYLGAYNGPNKEQFKRIFPVPLSADSGSGLAILERRLLHYPDIDAEGVPEATRRGHHAVGTKAGLFTPLLWNGRGIGAMSLARDFAGPFSEKEIALFKTFADQAVIAIQNAKLFREIQEKSAQLEVANKHKSDFLANMSHELRTPLNAIIGFSEALMDRMFGDLTEKQLEYQKDIHESGKHLLSLINDILDLSKIEAGRMELELSTFDLPAAVSNAVTLIRERAQRHGISLGVEVDPRLGEFQADERKVKQVLLNLLSNAVKFTPDGGRVEVSAKLDTDMVEIAVKDTGIGIAPEDQVSLFEEFKQLGKDSSRKAEGTGLGLALTRRLVELHGGQIRVESALDHGSTFRVALPLRR